MKYLFLGLNSRRLYLLSDSDLQSRVIRSGTLTHYDPQYVEVIELTSLLVISVPATTLTNRLVPDDRIHYELVSRRITGLKPIISLQAGDKSIPLAGNLNDPSWLSICLSGECGSKCVFCFTEFIRHDPGLNFDEVVESLDTGRAARVDSVVFSGGEPTLCKDLPLFLTLARERGYRQIGIQTNGHRLAREEYLTTLVEAGLSNVLVSLHGASAEIHDTITRTPHSYKRAVQAINNVQCTNVVCTVNFVVCKLNGPLATEMVEFASRQHWEVAVRFSFLIIEGAAHDSLRENIPTLPEFVEWIGAAHGRAKELGVAIEVDNVPPCISTELRTAESYSRSQRRSLMQVSPFYAADRYRGEFDVKLAACDKCASAANCFGLQMAYLAAVPTGAKHVYPKREMATAEGALRPCVPRYASD
jgi:MoaA/NifB/PqqE/SkfB family radical SAM enzyme